MSTFTNIINAVKTAETLHDKGQLLTYLCQVLSSAKKKPSPADRNEIGTYALSELENVPTLLNKAECYRQKDEIFRLMDALVGLVTTCYDTPAALPMDKVEMIQRVVDRCNKERFLERAIDEAFKSHIKPPDEAALERILCMVAPLKDEFHKGQLWKGLVHYKGPVNRLSKDARRVLVRYAVSELSRYAREQREGTLSTDGYANLEYICDAAGYFMSHASPDPELVKLIADLFSLQDADISYYALSVLLKVKYEVSDEVISFLAHDLTVADMTYHLLKKKKHGMTDRFPTELRDPAYLAKSDLVHWLTYPTELGKQPDAIELLGVTQKKGETFHIFRFKPDSNNLGDDLKGVWLIGWSGNNGGTFSNFDRYADYVKKTPPKTVRYIHRKLL